MKMVSFALVALLASSPAFAGEKVRVDIEPFKEFTKKSQCNAVDWWGADLLDVMRSRMEEKLNESKSIRVVDAERTVLYHSRADTNLEMIHKTSHVKYSQYSIRGRINVFEYCNRSNPLALWGIVEIQIDLLDNKTGQSVDTIVSKKGSKAPASREIASLKSTPVGNGPFQDSPLGQAMYAAISDVSERLAKRFPDADTSPLDYKVKLLNKEPGS